MSRPPKRKMPKKGTGITITYTDKEKDLVGRIREFVEKHGLEVEFVER